LTAIFHHRRRLDGRRWSELTHRFDVLEVRPDRLGHAQGIYSRAGTEPRDLCAPRRRQAPGSL
jgi:hypothetical protein